MRSALASLFHDRWRIGGVFALGLLLTLIGAALAPKTYTAEAELLLRLGREYIYKPEIGEAVGGAPVAYDREQTLLAEARILTSRDIMETVLDKLGAEKVFAEGPESAVKRWWRDTVLSTLRPGGKGAEVAEDSNAAAKRRAAAVVQFERALQAELLKGSNLMQVSFSGRDPQAAAAVLNEVIDAYLSRRSVIFASGARGTARANFEAREEQLKVAEQRLYELKLKRGIQAFDAEQNLLLAQRNGLEERRSESQVALARASGRAASLRESLRAVAADVPLSSETQRSEAVEKARSLLLDLKLKERDMSSQFTDDTPSVQDVRADIQRTTAYLNELLANPVRLVRSGRSPARDVVESDLLRTLADQQQAGASTQSLSAERAAVDRRLADLAASAAELKTLERERRLAEENFDAAAKGLRDEMAMAELDRERRSNVSIVQAPRVPLAAKSLVPVILLVGVFLSLCAALLTAFFLALWRDTFLTPEQVEETLGVPILATVPVDAR